MRFLELVSIFAISISLSMPLIGYWLGSSIIYGFYLLGIAASGYLFFKEKCSLTSLDLPFSLFIFMVLFSALYSVNENIMTELLYLPLIIALYIGVKAVLKAQMIHVFMYTIMVVFYLFSFYLLVQLSDVSFSYGYYYHYSNASNKVEYLTMTMFAGIILFYLLFIVKNRFIQIPLVLYTSFLIIVSGARFSIFFVLFLFFILFLLKLKSLKNIVLFFVFLLIGINTDYFLEQGYIDKAIETFNFTLDRLSHFDSSNASLQGRFYAIDHSIDAINNSVFFGYGLNSSPVVIHFIYPHNMFLEIWLDSGIFGFLSLLSLSFLVFYTMKRLEKNQLNIFLMVSFSYVFLSQLKSFSIYHSPFFFVFASLLLTAYTIQKRKKELGFLT